VQERLALIVDLKRKYGGSVADVLVAANELERELHANENADQRVAEIDAAAKSLEKNIREKGKTLFETRKKAAKLFSDSVTGELKDLNMSDAEFRVDLSLYESIEDWLTHGGPCGIQFAVRTNRGEEPRTLGKIASGGELSRMMLAIRRVISDRGGIGVYLFDEIDAGIGGSTAFQVGKKLKSVSKYNQVICITHVPQVAAFADHHLSVRKTASGKRTVTAVEALEKKERQEEIARMLGGAEITKSSLKNAAELITSAR
jgi:DNA repair protein RecN (Recombination protein N)